MARSEARIFTSIWKDQDFLALPPAAQRLYMFLLSQDDLTQCGVLALRPRRWASKAAGLTAADIEQDLKTLAAGLQPFVVIDDGTEELLVRSLVRRDEIWKQPNVMKSAREAARLVESPSIRAALLAELRRIPAQRSESRMVRGVHEAFVEDLQTGSGNPSPNPSGNPSRKGSANPSRNPSAEPSGDPSPGPSPTPSQGKGEGYGSSRRVSPYPSPPPPARTHAPAREDTPVAAEAQTGEEGEGEDRQQTRPDVAALAAEVRAIRPDWSTASIRRALTCPDVAERPWPLIRAAALAVARDRASEQPGRLTRDGPWWYTAPPSPQLKPVPEWCGNCSPTRRLEDGEGLDAGPCPACHPSVVRTA